MNNSNSMKIPGYWWKYALGTYIVCIVSLLLCPVTAYAEQEANEAEMEYMNQLSQNNFANLAGHTGNHMHLLHCRCSFSFGLKQEVELGLRAKSNAETWKEW